MKKIISLLFATVFCFALAGCAPETPQTGGSDGTETIVGGTTEGENPPQTDGADENGEKAVTEMYLTVNGNKLKVTLAENAAVTALIELLNKGDIVYTADDYGGFEKVGSLGHTLPASDTQIKTEPGDIVLYNKNQIVVFYGNNSWSYTKIGKIEGYSVSELKTLLGAGKGEVKITLSLK